MIAKLEPSAIFGTQMERHIGKRLDIPCGVISAPVHIQNFPLGYRPFLGYEGTNQIADLVYNSFSLGMEDHLLEIFSGHDKNNTRLHTKETFSQGPQQSCESTLSLESVGFDKAATVVSSVSEDSSGGLSPLGLDGALLNWDAEALKELSNVPGFVRGKVKRNTEKYARQNSISLITLDVLFAAKEALSA